MMKSKLTARMLSLIILGVSLGASFPLSACSYDGQFINPFSESVPGSLDVAFATSSALNSQQLKRVETLNGQQGLRRASWWLQLMVKQHSDSLEAVQYIYLTDSHLWSRIEQGEKIEVHTSPADDAESVLLLSEAALFALVSDQLDMKTALNLGIAKSSRFTLNEN
ncbi:hypothetical protein VSVS05_01041 [Vibrio scophthalmi]|uniref:Uncharacterized protein n=3 Tax=Vibrio scophthalmi TaxID=45658 RepID=A0A1C7F8X2_9VIBR|nr:hypothetical protein VSVS05_01041 [Vibrio scophthalmi]